MTNSFDSKILWTEKNKAEELLRSCELMKGEMDRLTEEEIARINNAIKSVNVILESITPTFFAAKERFKKL